MFYITGELSLNFYSRSMMNEYSNRELTCFENSKSPQFFFSWQIIIAEKKFITICQTIISFTLVYTSEMRFSSPRERMEDHKTTLRRVGCGFKEWRRQRELAPPSLGLKNVFYKLQFWTLNMKNIAHKIFGPQITFLPWGGGVMTPLCWVLTYT